MQCGQAKNHNADLVEYRHMQPARKVACRRKTETSLYLSLNTATQPSALEFASYNRESVNAGAMPADLDADMAVVAASGSRLDVDELQPEMQILARQGVIAIGRDRLFIY